MSFIFKILDLLFPPKCVFCAKVLNKSDDGWCDKCTESLPYTDNLGKQDGDVFDFCVSPLYYTGTVRRSLLRYKFKNASYYSSTYRKVLADCIRELRDNNSSDAAYDIISWVPLSKKRERKRGYDQAMLLANETAFELGDVAVETLKKAIDVQPQSELGDKAERSVNNKGAYVVSDSELISGKRILLIDDIVTTGSTFDECARVLLSSGAKSVICATLARGE
ncbi:MAG: ComF family protein [Oscillospiraceae bacterium]|nr:ComF family protein [Oscillospiraceae bacterium]